MVVPLGYSLNSTPGSSLSWGGRAQENCKVHFCGITVILSAAKNLVGTPCVA
jgi:hypothetical protein